MNFWQVDLGYSTRRGDESETKKKIMKLQLYEQRYKEYANEVNASFTRPNQLDWDKIAELIDCEELELNKFIKISNSLEPTDRRPYIAIIAHYQSCLQQHHQLLELLQDNQQQFIERAKISHQINQKEFQQYLESLSVKYQAVGIMALVGSFIIHLIIGASYRWNMVNPYITSYFKITSEPYLIIPHDSIASPLSLFCMGLGMRAGLRFQQFLGVTLTCILSFCLASASVYISSFMPSFETFIFFAFALYPFFASLAFQLVISQCCNYYRKYRLIITGFLLIGTGFGHVLFGLLNTRCCNPGDLEMKDGFYGGDIDFIARKVPSCMQSMGYTVVLAGTVAIALLYPAISFNSLRNIETKKNNQLLDYEHTCASEKQALKSKIFWIMVAMVMCTTSANYFLITNYASLCRKYNTNSLSLASIMLGFNVANAFSRAFWDFLFPKIGFKWCLVIINTINAFNLGTIEFILQDERLYSIYFVFGGICLGGCMLCFLNFATLVFGQEIGQQLPGYIWTAYSLASLLQYLVFNSYDLAHVGYLPSCMVLSLLNLLSLGMVIRTKLQGQWQNSLHLLELKCCFS